jgi:aarF domain-containing kinase
MLLPIFAKHQWRSVTFYSKLTPILWRCYRTKRVANRSIARGKRRKAAILWRARHEAESQRVIELLLHMKGFYLKLGQVLASKGDILPAPYLREMSRLFGDLPPVPFEEIQDTVEFELDIDDLGDVFDSVGLYN